MPQSPAAEKPFFVTTPIYYVNARPHIGHAYTTIVADVVARRHRLLGHPTFFLTGTDEHGQKIERSAAAAGVPPLEFADEVSASFRALWDRMGITYTDFIRTTEPRHAAGVQHLFRQLEQNGAIYKGTYTGQYCVSDEAYVEGPPGIHCPDCGRLTETVSEENFYFRLSQFQLPLLNLIESNTLRIEPDSRRNEVLSFLTGPVNQLIKAEVDATLASETAAELSDPQRVTESQLDELASQQGSPAGPARTTDATLVLLDRGALLRTAAGTPYVPGALKDLSISRTSFSWGIPVPASGPNEDHAERHVIYVWLDALANYMTALGYGQDPKPLFDQFWPADLHLVGKEIIRFHCVYWPAFLLALDPNWATHIPPVILSDSEGPASSSLQSSHPSTLAFDPAFAAKWLPKSVVAHGWLLFEESKMSKSRGNIVRTETILDGFGDHVFAKQFPESTPHERDLFATDVLRYFLLREIPFGQDGSFSFDAMITRYNADLANGYGNLVSRTLSMIAKYRESLIPHFASPVGVKKWVAEIQAVRFEVTELFDTYRFAAYIEKVSSLISTTDFVISSRSPWQLAKSEDGKDAVALSEILYISAESIRLITAQLYPILPFSTARVWAQLGLGDIDDAAHEGKLTNLQWGGLQPGTKLGPLAPIFPRADKGLAQIMADTESSARPASLQNVVNDEHDAATSDHTAFREAPLASAATPQANQPLVAEATSEAGAHTPGTPPPMAHSNLGSNNPLSRNPGVLSTGAQRGEETRFEDSAAAAAGPRTSTLVEAEPILNVAGSTATTTASPAPSTTTHVDAEPSGIFASATAGTPVFASPADGSPQITIDDFAKVELRIAQILSAERIPKADKLLLLEVDLGYERRQILSGIAEWYTPAEIVGLRIIVITNLAPRKMRGLTSHGMLLAASGPADGPGGARPIFVTVPEPVPVGTRLR